MSDTTTYHKSVLAAEVIYYMAPRPGGLYVDATFGGGGHTRALLEAEPRCKVIALDWDKNALEHNGPLLQEQYGDRIELLWGSFGHLHTLLKKMKIKHVDGILADFGTSQFQIHQAAGFSFNVDTPLDMRMSPGHYKVTAYDIVNQASEHELATLFYKYGEEHQGRKIARAIVSYREESGRISTTKELADLISKDIPRQGRAIHPATKVFQALRIVVNDEINNIKSLLTQSLDLLADDGRIVCISFHSLEDRLVKHFFKEHKMAFTLLTPRVVTATDQELASNPSSRSAKLRAAIRNIR